MNSVNALETTLKKILLAIQPSREDWDNRLQVIDELRNVLQSTESFRGATVEPFGSFLSNLSSRWGDLDISIDLSRASCISSASKKRKQRLLEELLRAMRQRGQWNRLQFIPRARVPILKFERNLLRISCDISIDNIEGQLKSKLLYWINEIDGRFRDMVLLVKEWAKANSINDSKSGTFNSYSLCLLVIFHFQTCVPPIFPPLKDIYPRNAVHDLVGERASAVARIASTCATNIGRFKSKRPKVVNRSSLSELFLSFLAKFSDIDVKAQEFAVCPYTGKWEALNSNMSWLPRTYEILIEDPFEQPQNTSRGVSFARLMEISHAFMLSRHSLVTGNRSETSILDTLTRPRISRFIPGAPVGASGLNASQTSSSSGGGTIARGHKNNLEIPWRNGGFKTAARVQSTTQSAVALPRHKPQNRGQGKPRVQNQFRGLEGKNYKTMYYL